MYCYYLNTYIWVGLFNQIFIYICAHTNANESAAVRPHQHSTRAPSNNKIYYKHNRIIIKYTYEPIKFISYIQLLVLEYCEGMSAATPLNSTTKAPTHHQIMRNTTSRILCMLMY